MIQGCSGHDLGGLRRHQRRARGASAFGGQSGPTKHPMGRPSQGFSMTPPVTPSPTPPPTPTGRECRGRGGGLGVPLDILAPLDGCHDGRVCGPAGRDRPCARRQCSPNNQWQSSGSLNWLIGWANFAIQAVGANTPRCASAVAFLYNPGGASPPPPPSSDRIK